MTKCICSPYAALGEHAIHPDCPQHGDGPGAPHPKPYLDDLSLEIPRDRCEADAAALALGWCGVTGHASTSRAAIARLSEAMGDDA